MEGSSIRVAVDWDQAFQAHAPWLRHVVLARVGEPAAVDDVLQEVALAAVRQQAPLRDPSKVGPWLHRLAVRQSLQHRRRQGRQRKLLQRYAERETPREHDTGSLDPLVWLVAEERRLLVRRALTHLRGGDTEILLLKYVQQWTYQQIAEHLGVSATAIESRLQRARSRLRSVLDRVASREMSSP